MMDDFSSSTFVLKEDGRVKLQNGDGEEPAQAIGGPQNPAAHIKTEEEAMSSPAFPPSSSVPQRLSPLPFGENLSTVPGDSLADDAMDQAQGKPKKKGMAATVKKTPRRAKPAGGPRQQRKAFKAGAGGEPGEPGTSAPHAALAAVLAAESGDDESDNGPYCICRGPDDHRWMIQCDQCMDWFHGECVKLDKEIGENLVEKFVCPNCTDLGRGLITRYKKTCAVRGCRRPARLYESSYETSVYCSEEHRDQAWEQMIQRLPKQKNVPAGQDTLTQEQFMAILDSGLVTVDEDDGAMKFARPFMPTAAKGRGSYNPALDSSQVDEATFLNIEETALLRDSRAERADLVEEKQLNESMGKLLDWAAKRRQEAVDAKRFDKDQCGYDSRLDSVTAKHQFAAFMRTEPARSAFADQRLGDPTGGDSLTEGMCDRKRCKPHHGWYGMLKKAVLSHMRELDLEHREKVANERAIWNAAEGRSLRLQRESNSVEYVGEDAAADAVMSEG